MRTDYRIDLKGLFERNEAIPDRTTTPPKTKSKSTSSSRDKQKSTTASTSTSDRSRWAEYVDQKGEVIAMKIARVNPALRKRSEGSSEASM